MKTMPFLQKPTRINENLTFVAKILCFIALFFLLSSITLKAQTDEVVDSLFLVAVSDQVNAGPGASTTIAVLENDGCSLPDDPNCAALLEGLQITDYTFPINGELILEEDKFIYTPYSDFIGFDHFEYYISSNQGQFASAIVLIQVGATGSNCPPPSTVTMACPIRPNCGLICNSSIGVRQLSTPTSPINVNNGINVPGWDAAQGTPNVGCGDPFGINSGAMALWRQTNTWGEAAFTDLTTNVTPSNIYLLTYTRESSSHTGNPQVDLFMTGFGNGITTCNNGLGGLCTTNGFHPDPSNANGLPQIIFNDPSILVSNPFQRVAGAVVPTSNYTQFVMYPYQVANPASGQQVNIMIDEVELVEYPPLSFTPEPVIVNCNVAATLTAPSSCTNLDTDWHWIDPITGATVGTGATFTTPPIVGMVNYIARLVPTAQITFGPTIEYTYTVANDPNEPCCCDDFVHAIHNSAIGVNTSNSPTISFTPPSAVQANDVVYWDFTCDGTIDASTTGTTSPPNQTYPVGNHVVCITVERIQADGDTCYAKQTAYFTIEEDCAMFVNATLNSSGILIDMSFLPTVTFYPPNNLLPTDLVDWDFDCDGVFEITGSGGTTPVTNNYPTVGGQAVCIVVTRTLSDGTICTVDLGKDFVIPCANSGNECCKCDQDFFNDIALGYSHFLTGLTASFVPNGDFDDDCDVVNWDFGDGNTAVTIGNDVATHTYATAGRYGVCMRVDRDVDGDGIIDCEDIYCMEISVMDDDLCCECDQEFFNDVQLGYSHFLAGLTANFVPNGDFDEDCDQIRWTFGDGNIGNSTGNNVVTHTYGSVGTYVVCMLVERDIDGDGAVDCESEFCNEIIIEEEKCCECDEQFFIDIFLGFTHTANGLTCTFTPIANFDVACDIIEWHFGDGNTATSQGSNSITHTYAMMNTYSVCMHVMRDVDQDGLIDCEEAICVDVMKPTSVSDIHPLPQIEVDIYPNPTTDFVKIVWLTTSVNDKLSYQVLDMHGKIMKTPIRNQKNASVELDLTELPKGIYLIKIGFGTQTYVEKIVKQ